MSDLRELLERLRNAPDEEALVAIDEAITVLRRVVCRWCGKIEADHLGRWCNRNDQTTFMPMEARND